MTSSSDSEIAHLAQMVASLAVQVAALSPGEFSILASLLAAYLLCSAVNNADVGGTAQPPAAQTPAAQTLAAAQAPAANQAVAPVVQVSNAPAAGSASAESSDDPGVVDDQPSSSSAHRRCVNVFVGGNKMNFLTGPTPPLSFLVSPAQFRTGSPPAKLPLLRSMLPLQSARNQELLHEKARMRMSRMRMSRLRANNATKSNVTTAHAAAAKRASQTMYRQSHRDILRAKEARRRISKKVLAEFIAAFPPIVEADDAEDAQCSYASDSGYLADENISDNGGESESESEAADQVARRRHGTDLGMIPSLPKTAETEEVEICDSDESDIVEESSGENDEASDDEPFAPDKYTPGLHYFTTECQEVDWRNHREVCQPIPPGRHLRAITRFNYRYGRYIHALALHLLAYSELPRSNGRRDMSRERLDMWKKTSNAYAVVIHLRQNDHTTHYHPYHDFCLASSYKLCVPLLDIIERGFKARAEALLSIRQEEMTCVVVIVFENKAGMGIGQACFLHKVEEFGVNVYARASYLVAPKAFRRILLHKSRKIPKDTVA
ncbi:hypothetical protein EYR40_002386 [Pleurotus pulmonarius]|nr:hypothetical protein EYR40_002386 [Pleurotus pulmonarius]